MVQLVRIGDDMKEVLTESILSLIKDNINLPFYVFVNCDDIDTYSYSFAVQKIANVDIGYIWSDDDNRVYWDVDDVADDFYENMTDEWLEEHGFDTNNMSNEDYDRLYQMCVDMAESLDWEKCIVAWTYNV